MKRRDFLRTAAVLGAASMIGTRPDDADAKRLPGGSILDRPAAAAPIDTIVVCMMENRSFDHYMGWLATDETYLETGRSLWGKRFRVDGSTTQTYARANGTRVATYPMLSELAQPWRGCGFRDPGHGWNAGRAQRDGGFLATGSGNDEFALGWYRESDLPFYGALTRRFTTFDRYHCSVLGPTYPNREYLHSAQSGGLKNNAFPFEVGYPNGFPWATIWDRLAAAGVPARYYYVDLPFVALFGPRLAPIASPIANYFEDAAAGRLPRVVFLDPGFLGEFQSDEHPHGDVRDGQRLVQQFVKAFVESPHWRSGAFILTYDEWGGFFDHVAPPRLRDDRANRRDDQNDFSQAGFRVPTRLISPFARRNFVDHRVYDHTSILRFIEWRFLGTRADGVGSRRDPVYLTERDRHAKNIAQTLSPTAPDFDFDTGPVDPGSSPGCGSEAAATLAARAALPPSDFERGVDWVASQGYRIGNWLPGR
ncbi:MAG: twin-arginine translocation signal domain-containing protein [bacterium]|nr:twin-arginine translocation signal domain-containing protein [bacterium]